jgi:hypothetical protein
MTKTRKLVALTPKKIDKKGYLQKHVQFLFLAEIFYIFNYICIARQSKNDFHYSKSHFGHLEIFQQRIFM